MQLLKRAAALACSLALCASLMPAAVFADEGTEETTTPPATEESVEPETEPEVDVEQEPATVTEVETEKEVETEPAVETESKTEVEPELEVEKGVVEKTTTPAPEVKETANTSTESVEQEVSLLIDGPAGSDAQDSNDLITVYYVSSLIDEWGATGLTVKVQDVNGEPLADDIVLTDVRYTESAMRVSINENVYRNYVITNVEVQNSGKMSTLSSSLNDDQNRTFLYSATQYSNDAVLVVTLATAEVDNTVITLTDKDGNPFGTIDYVQDDDFPQTTTVKVYLNDELVQTVEGLKLSNTVAGTGTENFVLALNDNYYFAPAVGGLTTTVLEDYDFDRFTFVPQSVYWHKDVRNDRYTYLTFANFWTEGSNVLRLNFYTNVEPTPSTPAIDDTTLATLFGDEIEIYCKDNSAHRVMPTGLLGTRGNYENQGDYYVEITGETTATLHIQQSTPYVKLYEGTYGDHSYLEAESVLDIDLICENKAWRIADGQENLTIVLTCEDPNAPEKPTAETVNGLGIHNAAAVECVNKDNNHPNVVKESYVLLEDSYTISEVQKDTNGSYYVELKVTPEKYVAQYEITTGIKHTYDSTAYGIIRLNWSDSAWVVDDGTLNKIEFEALCDTSAPKLPDEEYVANELGTAVTVQCINNDATHSIKTVYTPVMGSRETSYVIDYAENDTSKAIIQINVASIGLYTGAMDWNTNSTKHTFVSDGSDLTVELAYDSVDKVWKVAKYAVVNVNCTTTGGNTGDSGNTGSSCDHDYVWQHSPDEHWQYCNKCGQVISNGAHNFQWKDGYQECTVCGYRVTTTSTAASANNSANNGTAATAAGNTSTAAAATSVNGIPQTSDEMPLGLLAGSTVIAAAAFVALTLLRKRRQQ